jgi:signal transduction histidine kinase
MAGDNSVHSMDGPPPPVALHPTPAQISAARAALASATLPTERAAAQAQLAWSLRERAPAEAVLLAGQARKAASDAPTILRAYAAECRALGLIGASDEAHASLRRAKDLVPTLHDAASAGDLEFVAGQFMQRAGSFADSTAMLQSAAQRFDAAGLTHRALVARACEAAAAVPRDPAGARAQWGEAFLGPQEFADADVAAPVAAFRGSVHYMDGDFAAACRQFQIAAERAQEAGMMELAASSLTNIASALSVMGDLRGAIEYGEASLDISRSTGLALIEADTRITIAITLSKLGHLDAARTELDLSRDAVARWPQSKPFARWHLVQADWLVRRTAFDEAIATLEQACDISRSCGWRDLLVRALLAIAETHAQLGHAEPAVRALDELLPLALALGERSIEAYVHVALGRLHALHEIASLPREEGQTPLQAQIAELECGLAMMEEVGATEERAAVCFDLARAWETHGDLARALEIERRGRELQAAAHDQRTADQAQAWQLRGELQRARAQAAHSAETASLLARLSDVGRNLTEVQDPQQVIDTLVRRAIELLPCDAVAVFRFDAPSNSLHLAGGSELGRVLSPFSISLDDPDSGAARAARERLAVHSEGDDGSHPVAGTRAMRSSLFACLSAGDRLIGAMTVQTEHALAYQNRELLTMRALAAFGAVALSNADNAAALREASAAKSRFLAHMSHELRTPLNAINGFAQILAAEGAVDEAARSRLSLIQRSGTHLLALIDDLLDFSRIEAGRLDLHPQTADLRALLRLVADIVRAKADEKKLLYRFEVDPRLPARVSVDEMRLRQVLINLLGNAVKFTDAGEVKLKVDLLPMASERAGFVRLRFGVSDTGVGIAAENFARIFDAFEQVGDKARRRAGTGLGLAVSRQLVRLMGSDIGVESTPGSGSRFHFEIEVPAGDLR